MAEVMNILAPAKINLNLRVLRREKTTGFHDIETWMVPVSLADELQVELSDTPGIRLTCSDASLGAEADNLAWKAAALFLRESQIASGVNIALQKNIPHGAGLGGGSSDASAVLIALNKLSGVLWPTEKLETLAAQLGSDIPFFLRRRAAMASGRGEILTPHPLPHTLPILLLKPPFGIETAWAYGRWASKFPVPHDWVAPQSWGEIEIFNHLEAPVFSKHLMLPALKVWLRHHPLVAAAGMSGSGSCLFAILRHLHDAEDVAMAAKVEFGSTLWTAACQTEA